MATQTTSSTTDELGQEIYKLIQSIGFGSIEIIIHNGEVVQIEKHEKFRLTPAYQGDQKI